MTPTWLASYQKKVHTSISHIFATRYLWLYDTAEEKFFEAMRYAVEGGGKRLRTILAMVAYESIAQREVPDTILRAMVGIEMIHAYTLVHDDLPCMDNDVLRRGKPTVWKQYGETMAVLVGDGLQTLGFELLASAGDIRVMMEMTRVLGDMWVVRWQVRDTVLIQKNLTIEELLRIHDEKTGGFIASSLVIGAILGSGSYEQIKILRTLGMLLGRAFQIQDDILDYEGNPDVTGKQTQKDASQWKGIVGLLGIDRAKEMLKALEQEMNMCLESLPDTRFHDIVEYVITREK